MLPYTARILNAMYTRDIMDAFKFKKGTTRSQMMRLASTSTAQAEKIYLRFGRSK
jgi:hypothetical protein